MFLYLALIFPFDCYTGNKPITMTSRHSMCCPTFDSIPLDSFPPVTVSRAIDICCLLLANFLKNCVALHFMSRDAMAIFRFGGPKGWATRLYPSLAAFGSPSYLLLSFSALYPSPISYTTSFSFPILFQCNSLSITLCNQ